MNFHHDEKKPSHQIIFIIKTKISSWFWISIMIKIFITMTNFHRHEKISSQSLDFKRLWIFITMMNFFAMMNLHPKNEFAPKWWIFITRMNFYHNDEISSVSGKILYMMKGHHLDEKSSLWWNWCFRWKIINLMKICYFDKK